MTEQTIEFPKTPDSSNWSKLLETITKKRFLIQTSNPLLQGARWAEYKENSNSGGELRVDGRRIDQRNDPTEGYFNFKRDDLESPEVVIFTKDNKLIYLIDTSVVRKKAGEKEAWKLADDERMLDEIAIWIDIHSSIPRSGNMLNLCIDLQDPNLFNEIEKEINSNPEKVREVLESIVFSRMQGLKQNWIKYDLDNLPNNLQNIMSLEKKVILGSLRPPYEAWKKLGFTKVGIQHSDSTKENPNFEYRELKNTDKN